jgi:leucyl aminopeptidase
MEVVSTVSGLKDSGADVLVIPVFEGDSPRDPIFAALDERELILSAFETGQIKGTLDTWVMLHRAAADGRLLLYGAGSAPDEPLLMGRVLGAAVRLLLERGARSICFLVRGQFDPTLGARAAVEGAIIASLNYDRYRSDRRQGQIEKLIIASEQAADLSRAIEIGRLMGEATNSARALGNEPSNVLTPRELAHRAIEIARGCGLKSEVLDENQLREIGMNALLAVARGSAEPPRLILLRYEPEDCRSDEIIALLGKGLTFDSGGISIKPAQDMDEMKFDMCGGAAVIGAMQAIAGLRPRARVLGMIAAVENMPSGRAYKPGDVIRSLSGKTIEIINTDAEGRVALADCLTYAQQLGATCMIDIATLTGACVVALGEVRAGIWGTDEKLINELIRAGHCSGERLWHMPIDPEYSDMIRSDIADIKNAGNRQAGAITAAAFLESFARPRPWAHLDIAGTAWINKARPHMDKGATGFGVRTLANFVLNRDAAQRSQRA